MKLVERTGDRLVFRLGAREKSLLERLLSYYPMRPDADPTLSKGEWDGMKDAAALLRESLLEQRVELAEWIKRRLTDDAAFTHADGGWKLRLEGSEPERLLQVLNELRVGAWTRLGCPDELDEMRLVTSPSQAPLYAIMTLAGQYEMVLVHAMHGDFGEPDEDD